MKKILSSILIIVLTISCFGCVATTTSKQEQTKTPEETQQNTINDESETTEIETTTVESTEQESYDPIFVTDKVGTGCTYYQDSTNRTYIEGSPLPTPQNYDKYITNDYTYYFLEDAFGEGTRTWMVEVNDTKKTSYEPIITSIAGEDIYYCRFTDCVNMKKSPKLPDTITVMYFTYKGCTSLVTAPEIPEGVTSMKNAFEGCTSLTTAPIIPKNVIDLEAAFGDCRSLTGSSIINAENVESYKDCFYNVNFSSQKLIITGTSSQIEELKATGIN